MNWQTSKPDSPGIWWWCDGVSDEVVCWRAWNGMCVPGLKAGAVDSDGRSLLSSGPIADLPDGYWLKQSPPPSFIAPKPPVLEWDEVWEATYEGGRRWLYRKGDRLLSMTDDGSPSATTSWDWASVNYQLIRKVSP